MKKWLLLIIVILCFITTSCSDKTTSSNQTKTENQQEQIKDTKTEEITSFIVETEVCGSNNQYAGLNSQELFIKMNDFLDEHYNCLYMYHFNKGGELEAIIKQYEDSGELVEERAYVSTFSKSGRIAFCVNGDGEELRYRYRMEPMHEDSYEYYKEEIGKKGEYNLTDGMFQNFLPYYTYGSVKLERKDEGNQIILHRQKEGTDAFYEEYIIEDGVLNSYYSLVTDEQSSRYGEETYTFYRYTKVDDGEKERRIALFKECREMGLAEAESKLGFSRISLEEWLRKENK